MKLVSMYSDIFASLRFKNVLVPVLFIKLILLWAMFHYLYQNPYKASPHNVPSAIAEKLKPQK